MPLYKIDRVVCSSLDKTFFQHQKGESRRYLSAYQKIQNLLAEVPVEYLNSHSRELPKLTYHPQVVRYVEVQ